MMYEEKWLDDYLPLWEAAYEAVVIGSNMDVVISPDTDLDEPVALAHAALEATDAIEEAMQKSSPESGDPKINADISRIVKRLRRPAENILYLANYLKENETPNSYPTPLEIQMKGGMMYLEEGVQDHLSDLETLVRKHLDLLYRQRPSFTANDPRHRSPFDGPPPKRERKVWPPKQRKRPVREKFSAPGERHYVSRPFGAKYKDSSIEFE